MANDEQNNKLPSRITFPFVEKWDKAYTLTCVSHKAGIAFEEITEEKNKKGMGTVCWNAKFENLFQKHTIGWDRIKQWAIRIVCLWFMC